MSLIDRFWQTVNAIKMLCAAMLSVKTFTEQIAVMLVVSRHVVLALHQFI